MKKRGFIFLTGLIIISSIVSTRYFSLKKSTSYAINVGDTLGLIGKNNSINKALRQEIKAIEKEKAEKKIKIAREERNKKLEAERQRKLEKERQEKLERERQEKLERERQRNLEKVAYLTFDDGPSTKATPLVLDILKEYNIKATFFVLGSMAEQNPQILKRIHEEGHRIGNHSYSHKYNYIYKSVHNFFQDFKRSEEVLKSILGEDFNTNIIRFPGGSSGKQKAPMRIAAKDAGYNYYDWNALNGDAESLNLNKEHLLQRLKATTHNKKEAVILMHDTDSKMETVETLRSSIDYLIKQGFHFELLQ